MSTLKTNNIQHVDRSDPSIIINTDGGVSIAGTLTYEDVTSVDAVGIVTAREILNAQKQVHVGTGVSVKAGGIFVTAGISTFGGDIQAQGDVSIVDTIYHAGDTNTKIRFPSADTISFETGGTERLSIESDGTFAFGNVTPGGNPAAKNVFLCIGDSDSGIVQDGDGNIEIFANDAEIVNFNAVDGSTFTGNVTIPDKIIHSGDTNTTIRFPAADTISAETGGAERIRINSQGKVLVNTTTASSVGNSQYSRLEVSGNSSTSTGPAHFTLKSGTVTTSLSSGDTLARLIFSSLDGGDYTYIQASADAAPGSSDYPGRLMFFTTANGASSATERLRIKHNGHIAIGDDITNDTGMFKVIAADGDSDDLYVGQFENREATAGRSYGVNIRAGSNSTDHGLRVMNRANDTTQFLVRGDGRIGINDNSPDNILHITDGNPYVEIEGTSNSGDAGVFLNAKANHWIMRADNSGSQNIFSVKSGDPSSSTHRFVINSAGDFGFNDTSITAHASSNNTVLSLKGKGSSYSGKIDFKDSDGNLDSTIISDNAVLTFECDTGAQNGNTIMQFKVHGNNERMRLNASGNLTVGTTNDDGGGSSGTDDGCLLRNDGLIAARISTGTNSVAFTAKTTDTGGATALRCMSAQTQVGSVTFNSGGTAFNTSSDYRRKENVIDLTGAIARLKTLLPKRFNFIDEPSVTRDGFLAHEVTTVPEAVWGTKDAVEPEDNEKNGVKKGDPIYQQLDQSKLVPLLTAALQEAITKIETLEKIAGI